MIRATRAPTSIDRHWLTGLLLITLLAFAARVIHLGGDSFWFDELLTFQSATQSLSAILAEPSPSHPPGFYLLEYGVVQIWGATEFALRLPSALAGVLTIPLVYVIGSVIANRRVGAWAALLLAVSTFHIRYSQEARGYAVQVMWAAVATACLLLAVKRQQWRWWIGFGVSSALGAYTLFGAFLVVLSQVVYVGLLIMTRWIGRRQTWRDLRRLLIGLGAGLAVTAIVYSPYIGPAIDGVLVNVGPEARQGAWFGVPLSDWASAGYLAFGYGDALTAAGLGGLALIGLAAGIVRRNASAVLWPVSGSLAPLLAINLAGISRAPLPKYVLFILPVYLLAAALGLVELIDGVTRRAKQPLRRFAPFIVGSLLLMMTLPAIAAEHARAEEDWRAIGAYLQRAGGRSPVVVPVTLDLPDSFNQGYEGLNHYLPRYLDRYYLLAGEHLTDVRVADLSGAQQAGGDVWLIVLKRDVPLSLPDAEFEVKVFQGGTYVVRPRRSALPLESMLAVYPRLIEQARTPCYLWLDTARLHLELDQFAEARAALDQVRLPCPNSLGTRQALYRYLLDHYLQTQQTAEARTMARQLLVWDAKDKVAIQALTIVDLNTLFASADPAVAAQPSPARPIDTQRFTMPDSGDWGDALVMQTPAAVSFRLALPPEPVQFVSRVAMFPDSWEWGGDGADFRLSVQAEGEQSVTLYERYVSNALPDRTWHGVDVSLAAFAGRAITLTLETAPGPSGDTTGDWAGWDSPRIVFEAAGTP